MKLFIYETNNVCAGTIAYKAGNNAVHVYDNECDVVGVQIFASSFDTNSSNQAIRHFCEMVPRKVFDMMAENLTLIRVCDVDLEMSQVMA